ncbi:unnamed protein product [Rotaria sordida]|nr:unnamed protein product [Rotaria sordida]CAF1010394.1 unnamed protein product [Rotaria sordida]CAF1010955.1 unnamed protein product [Rotaria sordida]CAF1180968.1 unnamed protein product [Rotaria sordida]CAF4007408.1 unnamed protein product [Rotaria sordida]
MLLSVELCETHAKMLFDLLKTSTFESVKVAIMVLMNDFYLKYSLAFPVYFNDPYGCLRDRSDNTKQHFQKLADAEKAEYEEKSNAYKNKKTGKSTKIDRSINEENNQSMETNSS